MAISGIEMVLGAALPRASDIPLLALWDGEPKPIPAYGAAGYDGEVESARVAGYWVQRGFTGVKGKIGEIHGIRPSHYLWPEISAQLLCTMPTPHSLQYADWWNPVG